MIIDHPHDEKTDVVEDADDDEWKGFSSRSVTMPPNPLSTTRLQCNTLHKSALKIIEFCNSTLNTLQCNMQSGH